MDLNLRSWHENGDTDIFSKVDRFASSTKGPTVGRRFFYRPIEAISGGTVIVDGRRCLMLCSNDYLGLTQDVRVRNAAAAGAKNWGPSCTGSRILNGTLRLHVELESKVAEFCRHEAAAASHTTTRQRPFSGGKRRGGGNLIRKKSRASTLNERSFCHRSKKLKRACGTPRVMRSATSFVENWRS